LIERKVGFQRHVGHRRSLVSGKIFAAAGDRKKREHREKFLVDLRRETHQNPVFGKKSNSYLMGLRQRRRENKGKKKKKVEKVISPLPKK
jgi:hypothetical protein